MHEVGNCEESAVGLVGLVVVSFLITECCVKCLEKQFKAQAITEAIRTLALLSRFFLLALLKPTQCVLLQQGPEFGTHIYA